MSQYRCVAASRCRGIAVLQYRRIAVTQYAASLYSCYELVFFQRRCPTMAVSRHRGIAVPQYRSNCAVSRYHSIPVSQYRSVAVSYRSIAVSQASRAPGQSVLPADRAWTAVLDSRSKHMGADRRDMAIVNRYRHLLSHGSTHGSSGSELLQFDIHMQSAEVTCMRFPFPR